MASAAAGAGAAGPGGAPSPPCPPCPPYPPHELARLVLGYLEEEQCMSAYEEFIKSSPYLDTYRTDYMMTSLTSFTLKHIFNEYCAFKIYTRSCKPPALRRKLLQCRTLLDMAKVLVAHVDLNKLQNETPVDTHYKSGSNFIAPNPQNVLKTKECEVCKAIDNIDGCQCKVRRPILPNLFATPFKIDLQQAAVLTRMPLETLVETTQLSDLPGTSAAKKKSTDKEQPQQPSFYNAANNRSDSGPVIVRVEPAVSEERLCDQSAASSVSQVKAKPAPLIGAQTLSSKTTDLMGCTDITGTLTVVDRSSNTKASLMQAALAVETAGNLAVDAAARPAIMDRSFHQFASGAGGEGSNTTSSEAMPDSSTPETNIQAVRHNPSTKTYPASSIVLNPTPTRILPGYQKLISGSESSFTPDRQHSNSSSDIDMSRNSILCSSSTKFYEPKITIISNDIVKPIEEDGKLFISDATGEKCALKLLPGKPVGVNKFTKLTTSNAIIQVNGTPAYNGQPKSQKFTKEQIMAMPTVILVQSSNASTTTLNTTSAVTSAPMSAVPVDSGYRPLTIDVESTSEGVNNTEPDMIQPTKSTIESRTFIASDEIPNATVSMEKLSTPNVPRLVKKSSSTPRRTSHVRVLDFTTPRRILVGSCESLAENTTTGARTMTLTSITEFSQPDASMEGPIENQQEKKETEEKKNLEPLKKAKKDWDADLRALVVDSVPAETRKKSHRKKRKSPGDSSKENDDYHNKSKGKKVKKKSAKATKDKIVTLVVDEPQKAIVKPTINVVTDWKTASKENGTNAELPVSENNVTPEIDHRPPTANPPSAKHNFSDLFLQTPIKMILENIQMQTPRFLDPSILDQPISDIKIDNIQTPNFFNTPNFAMTPKAVGATPSSYNSRPTDYSSGGSYYRPDEHDYVPPIDFLPSDLQSDPQPQESKDIETKTLNDQDQDQELEDESIARSSRPRRQCTLKKVSYFDHPNTKDKNTRDKSLESVASLDTSGNAPTSDSSEEFIRKQSVEPHSFIQTKENINSKEELRLSIEEKRVRTIAALKKKSPMKNYKRNSTNNVSKMVNCGKITPRRPTPKVALNKKKPSPRKSVQSKDSTRKKSVSKDKPSTITPTMVPAPPKSRRKSSTPRKLQTQRFNANSIDDSASADIIKADKQVAPCDTEDELPPLRMSSEEGSRDSKCKRVIDYLAYREENDEIIQIKAYIEKSSEMTEPMYVDLIQRGFDMETAKRIERDLLGTPHRSPQESLRMENENEIPGKPYLGQEICNQNVDIANTVENIPAQIKYQEITANTSVSRDSSNAIKDNNANDSSQEQSSQKQNSIVIEGDIELSMCNVDEKSDNYFCCTFDETQPRNNAERITINDDFALEIDCEDYPGIKIQLIKFATVLDMPPKVLREENHPETSRCEARSISEEVPEEANEEEQIETVNAVDSIAHMTPLYTPIKDAMDKQCLEIFDSTLNSLDTPIKPNSPTKSRTSHNVIEEMDLTICSSKYSPTAKRKRSESPVESSTKKSRPEPKYLPIQNFDIESVLSKLHGP